MTPQRKQPPGLTRDRIIDTAIDLMDQYGVQKFTMRRLAVALDVQAPALYPYIQSKQRLFLDIFDKVVGESGYQTDESRTWQEETMLFMDQVRTEVLRHPWITHLIPGANPPGLFMQGARIQQLYEEQGLSEHEAVQYRRLLSWTIWGFASVESSLPTSPRHEPIGQQNGSAARAYRVTSHPLPDDEISQEYTVLDVDDLFGACVRNFLVGLEDAMARARATTSDQPPDGGDPAARP